MIAVVKGISEGIGVVELCREVFGSCPSMEICVNVSACKGMLIRTGAGRVYHLSTEPLWVQGAVQACGVAVRKYEGSPIAGRASSST